MLQSPKKEFLIVFVFTASNSRFRHASPAVLRKVASEAHLDACHQWSRELWSLAQTSPSQLWFPLGSGFTWFHLLSDLFPFCSKWPVSCSKCKAVLNLPKLPGVPTPSFKVQAEALVWLTKLRRWWPSNQKVRVTPWVSESRKRYHAPCAWQPTQSKCYRVPWNSPSCQTETDNRINRHSTGQSLEHIRTLTRYCRVTLHHTTSIILSIFVSKPDMENSVTFLPGQVCKTGKGQWALSQASAPSGLLPSCPEPSHHVPCLPAHLASPCPSRLIAQMPELATVFPRVAAMVAEALRRGPPGSTLTTPGMPPPPQSVLPMPVWCGRASMVPRCGGYFGHSRGRAEMHRVVMRMVCVVHMSRNTNNEMILYGDSIH